MLKFNKNQPSAGVSSALSVAVAPAPGVTGRELLDFMGVGPDQFLTKWFASGPDNDFYEAVVGGSEPLRAQPEALGLTSSLCQHLHFTTDEYRYWLKAMNRRPRFHRKDWEWFFAAQSLYEAGVLAAGKRGLGFAVGREPLPSLFAAHGCEILATDQSAEMAIESGWANSGQYGVALESLLHENVCPRQTFFERVRYRSVDMNDIPADLAGQFDFCWSSCALEHLGSLENGLEFIKRSLDTLKPGGIAVHTTEFNISSNNETFETPYCCYYRRRDLEALCERLGAMGHRVAPFDWRLGKGLAETVIDLPPYRQSPHLRVQAEGYEVTSVGIIVHRAG